jgi:hypothetical protein
MHDPTSLAKPLEREREKERRGQNKENPKQKCHRKEHHCNYLCRYPTSPSCVASPLQFPMHPHTTNMMYLDKVSERERESK